MTIRGRVFGSGAQAPAGSAPSWQAAALVTAGFAMYTVSDAVIKHISAIYGIAQVMFFNGLFGLCVILALVLALDGNLARVRTTKLRWHALRGVLMVLTSICNIYSLPKIPLANFYALIFVAPLMMTAMAALFLKDRVRPRDWLAIVIGLAGVLLVVRPDGGAFDAASLIMLLSAFFFASNLLIVRVMGAGESWAMLGLSAPVFFLLAALPFLPAQFVMPQSWAHWGMFAFNGACVGVATVFVSLGFQRARSTASVAPLHYTQILWGVLFGYFIYGDVPDAAVLAGAAVIILTGVTIIRSQPKVMQGVIDCPAP